MSMSTSLPPMTWLQWGHGDEAVEEVYNGPLSGGVNVLQWGHGDEAVEESCLVSGMVSGYRLQWGHGDEAVEELSGFGTITGLTLASMGPRR